MDSAEMYGRSITAMRFSFGLTIVSEDVVLPAPATRIFESPMIGMALRKDNSEPVGAFRVLLLVRGTADANVDCIDDNLPTAQQSFKVTSPSACCLLNDHTIHINLVGYCNFDSMMAYRLDKETALVLASAVATAAPGSANDPLVATVEHILTVSRNEGAALTINMGAEWKAVLSEAGAQANTPKLLSSQEQGYWSVERAKKMRRMQSEPQSPVAYPAARGALDE